MKSVSTDSNRVVSFGEKVSYGITEIACNPMYTIFCSFLVFFYTDVIGVNAAAVGTIILGSAVFSTASVISSPEISSSIPTQRAALPARGFCASPFPSASPISLCSQFRTVASGAS